MEFVRRGTRYVDGTAEVMVWRSRCGRYRVTRRRSLYMRDLAGRRRVRYHAMLAVEVLPETSSACKRWWNHVDPDRREYRTRDAAEAACREHAALQVTDH